MAKNKELNDAVNELLKRDDIPAEDKKAALDAILTVNFQEENAAQKLREAVKAHEEKVWGKFEGLMKPGTWGMGFLSIDDYFNKNDFLDPNDEDNPFSEIVQNAAEERVQLTLEEVDQEVLIGILKHNDAECREYLQQRLESKGINLAEIASRNQFTEEDELLSKDALERIKINSANKLLLQILTTNPLAKPEMQDRELYANLASEDLEQKQGAVKKLIEIASPPGLTEEEVNNIFTEDFFNEGINDSIIEEAENLNKQILEKANKVLLDVLNDDTLMTKAELKKSDLLEALASDNLEKIKEAVTKIVAVSGVSLQGLTQENIVKAFDGAAELNEEIRTKAKSRNKQILDEICVTNLKEQALLFNGVKDKDLLAVENKDLLNQSSEAFLADLVTHHLEEKDGKKFKEQFEKLPPEKKQEVGKEIQQRLGEHYLQALIQRDGATNYAEILGAKTKEEAIEKLKVGIPDHDDLIANAVTTDNFTKLQITLLHKTILDGKIKLADLSALSKATNLTDFKVQLSSVLRVPSVDFVKDGDLRLLHEEIRQQQFKLTVGEASRLGEKPHSKLIQLFDTLPPTKQKELIDNPKMLSSVMTATDQHVLKHYLGKVDDSLLPGLIQQNKDNAEFRKIHNAEIAKILANHMPSITLTSKVIEDINEAIKGAADKDLGNFDDYKALINEIKTKCGRAVDTELDKAFNIKEDGSDFTDEHPVATAIKDQHQNNKDLLKDTTLNSRLRDVLLRVVKKNANDFDANAIININTKFKDSKNIEEFLQKWPQNTPLSEVQKDLKNAVMKELTPALFREIKTEEKRKLFAEPTQQAKIIGEAKIAIKEFKKDHETFYMFHNSHLMALQRLDGTKDYLQTMQGKSRDKILPMKEQYQSLHKEFVHIVSKLQDNLNEINTLMLPEPLPNIANAKVKKEAETLQKELQEQKRKMEEGIQYYTEHARKTAQRLEDINSVLTDSKRQIYTPEGVDVTIKKRDKAKSMGDESVRSIAHVTARVNTGLESKKDIPDEALFRQVGKPNLDEVICFDTATKKEGQRYIRPGDDRNNVQTGDLEFEGRFIYDPKPNKSSSGRIEIVKFPECKQGECSPKFLTEARVDFAMKMVMQELVKRLNNNNPPTKEDPITIYGIKDKEIEAQYLWGACIAYGIEPDAIFVKGSSGFSPNNELDRGWLNTTVKKDGFYKKHFDDTPEKKTQLDHYTNAYKAKVEEKAKAVEASKGMDKAVASVVKRQEFADIRKDAQEREEKKKTQEAPEEISPEIAKMQQGPG